MLWEFFFEKMKTNKDKLNLSQCVSKIPCVVENILEKLAEHWVLG